MKMFEKFTKDILEIEKLCTEYKIQNYTINGDYSIDVNGSVWLNSKGLTKIPIKFRKVNGDFDCSGNQLIDLVGMPHTVVGNVYVNDNNLTTLWGCPQNVGGNFNCSANSLHTLEHSPFKVKGYYNFRYNPYLKTTKYATSGCKSYLMSENIPVEILNNRKYISEIINKQYGTSIWHGDQLNLSNFKRLMDTVK